MKTFQTDVSDELAAFTDADADVAHDTDGSDADEFLEPIEEEDEHFHCDNDGVDATSLSTTKTTFKFRIESIDDDVVVGKRADGDDVSVASTERFKDDASESDTTYYSVASRC